MAEMQLPAHLAARQGRGVASHLANLGSGAVPYISIKGSRFTLFDAAGNSKQAGVLDPDLGLSLDVVFVDQNEHLSKIYYEAAFDPNASEYPPPTCFSDNGVAPSSQAAKPQAKTCATCPNNVWGSDTSRLTGKATKACNDVQKLAVAVPGQGDILFLLRVPPGSLKFLGKYAREVGAFSLGNRKADVTDLVTRIHFGKDSPNTLAFKPVGYVDEAMAALQDKVWANKGADQLVGKTDQPFTGEIGVLPPAAPAAAPSQRTLPPPPAPQQAFMPSTAASTATLGEPGVATAAPAETPKKPRGRPKKEDAPAAPATQAPFMPQAAPTQQDDGLELPPFLRRDAAPPAEAPRAQPSFGMEQPQSPDDEMRRRIEEAMRA